MTIVDVSYDEAARTPKVEAVPLGHLSVETGHLYLEDFAEGDRAIVRQLEQAAPWLEAASGRIRRRFGRDARISTCFLVDDYTTARSMAEVPRPAEVVEIITSAADHAGFQIDYLAREAGCAIACERPYSGPRDRSALADIVAGLIVEEAVVGANGARPPTAQTGWLSNGERSPAVAVAMDAPDWEPPKAFGTYRHSVFVDIELWSSATSQVSDERQYSCSLLSAVWQLLRLGVLRDAGRAVARPYRFGPGEDVPDRWPDLPSITQLAPDAAPFAADEVFSILPQHFEAAGHAATIIVDHLRFDEAVRNTAGRVSHLYFDDAYVTHND